MHMQESSGHAAFVRNLGFALTERLAFSPLLDVPAAHSAAPLLAAQHRHAGSASGAEGGTNAMSGPGSGVGIDAKGSHPLAFHAPEDVVSRGVTRCAPPAVFVTAQLDSGLTPSTP